MNEKNSDILNMSVGEIKECIIEFGGVFQCLPQDEKLIRLWVAVRELAFLDGLKYGFKRGKSVGSHATYNKFVKGGKK